MEKNNQNVISELNALVEVNNDRIEGYNRASKETDDTSLKNLFSDLAGTSRKCREELAAEIRKLGGTPKEGTATSGKLFRIWMDIKAAVTNKDSKAILSSCETGEDAAVKTYKDALDKTTDVLSDHILMVQKQYGQIKADHDKVKQMRDSLINV